VKAFTLRSDKLQITIEYVLKDKYFEATATTDSGYFETKDLNCLEASSEIGSLLTEGFRVL
jgi:anti-sigma regulatory factor (Ser/Thr protein kinase)